MKKIHLIFTIIIIAAFVFSLINYPIDISIGDYTNGTKIQYDVNLKIDNEDILSDSILNSLPYTSNFKFTKKMRYGFHTISIYSNRLKLKQEKKVFLFPNQHISIEFIPADSLTLKHYNFPDSIIINGVQLSDSIIEQYKLHKESDFPIIFQKSTVDINIRFNPFYYR